MAGPDKSIRVLRTLGEGGFGAVYLVEVVGADGFVQRAALKVLHANMAVHRDLAGRQRDEARRVWDEALKVSPDNETLLKTLKRFNVR